jgi:hypothetical protein
MPKSACDDQVSALVLCKPNKMTGIRFRHVDARTSASRLT